MSGSSVSGGEWSFQKYGSRKIFVKFRGSRSLDFCADCQRLGVSNLCKVSSDYRSLSRILKGKKVSGLQRETPVSLSRQVSLLPYSPPLLGNAGLNFWHGTTQLPFHDCVS